MSDDNSSPTEDQTASTVPEEAKSEVAVDATPQAASDSQAASAPQPASEPKPSEEAMAESAATSEPKAAPSGGGPLSLDRIRQLRKSQQAAAPKRPPAAKPPAGKNAAAKPASDTKKSGKGPKGGKKHSSPLAAAAAGEVGVIKTPPAVAPRVEVPSVRAGLSDDLEQELSAALDGADLDSLLIGDESLQVGRSLSEGQRVAAKVVKSRDEFVFLSLGGPDEGMLPITQFEEIPEAGTQVEVIVRGFSTEEGLYELTLPGNAVDVSDWDDINEGEVIEVVVTGSNSGGLECKAGNIRGFIPASQVAEYRVENLGELVDQKMLCVVTEANERRGNLVLSRRAVLEREKKEKRAERLAAISVGDSVEGTVSRILDFGAFVDIGGLDGLLHISQLSWERVNHPSEILEEGQKVQVRIEKIDEQSGKIGLSYRSLQEHPWKDIDARFPVGSIAKGTVTRIAEFGAFVKLATGVEGLVHISELAHHRVSSVANVVSEGDEVEVKVLSLDESAQRMSLSMKAAQAAPKSEQDDATESQEEAPRPKPVLPKHRGPLKGGTGSGGGGEQFGLKW